ncbi:MAG: DsbA family protein [Acidimicrobiia bacterium]|nr:DsbA family protein [Acidimicrobiia bacterium]
MTRSFAVSFDYRCPFARNAHEAVVAGLRAGRDWDVDFTPFSLDQSHVASGEPPIWERPASERGTGVLALEWGVAVRDSFSDAFLDWHVATFAARHDEAKQIKEEAVLREVATAVGIDADAVAAEVATGRPLSTLAAEHIEAVERWEMFGVPTFVSGEEATFVRFMERGRVDDLDRFLDLLDWSRLNELKRTRIAR